VLGLKIGCKIFIIKALVKVEELVLIDDELLANKIHSRLIGSVNHKIPLTSFTDPLRGIEYLKKNPSGILLLLDINMPVMSGWDCLEFMKKNNIDTKVVILSSSINPIDRQRAMEYSNVTGFLNKPLTKETISQLFQNS